MYVVTMKTNSKAFILSCFALLLLLCSPAASQEPYQQLMQQATASSNSGNVDSALVLFKSALTAAESRYAQSDTTVDILFYKDGIP